MLVDSKSHIGTPQLRAAIDAMPHLVWIARPDGAFDCFNERWLAFTGQTQEQAALWGFRAALHPDDLQVTLERWQRSLDAGEPFEREFQLRRSSDSAFVWHLGRAVPVTDPASKKIKYWIATATDISHQKRELGETTAMLDHAIDSCSRQQTFLRDILATLTFGRLHLCDCALDLPPMRAELVRGFALTTDTYGQLRQSIRDLAAEKGFSAGRALDLCGAVGEAASNALVHCGGGTVRVHTDHSKVLQIWIEDAGPNGYRERPLQISQSVAPNAEVRHGHGFLMIVQLVDSVWLLPEPDGTTVVLEHYPDLC